VSDTCDAPEPAPTRLRYARTIARLLDGAVRVPGTSRRIGLDPLLSVVPVVGSGLGLLLSLSIVWAAAREGVPAATLARMLAHLALDAAVGAVPVAGPVADAVVRANERNVALFEAALADDRA
jgi:phosphotransferase system  glucose/maltose/N-acetylglucosamine-specific IIC component